MCADNLLDRHRYLFRGLGPEVQRPDIDALLVRLGLQTPGARPIPPPAVVQRCMNCMAAMRQGADGKRPHAFRCVGNQDVLCL